MFNLIPTLVSVAVSGVAKMMTSSGTDGSKAASGAAGKSAAGADGKDGKSGFQSVLDKQTSAQSNAQAPGAQTQAATPADAKGGAQGTTGATAPNSISADLLANLITDGDTHPGQAPRARANGDKGDTVIAAATAAPTATDLASLISASAAAANPAVAQVALAGVNTAVRTPEVKADATGALAVAGDGKRPAWSALGASVITARGNAATADTAASASPAADAKSFAAIQAAISADITQATNKPHSALELAAVRNDVAVPQSLMTQTAGGTPANASTNAVPSARLDIPVGTQGWDQALGQRVVWMVSQKDQTAELHVNPPELGPLTVTVNVTDSSASASFVAPHAATREAIADAMPRLRDMFADAGINLGQVSVSAESHTGGGANQAFQNHAQGSASGSAGLGVGGTAGSVPAIKTSRVQLGLVDTFA